MLQLQQAAHAAAIFTHVPHSSLANAQVGESAADPVTPKLQFGPDDGVLETNVALSSSYLAVRRCMQACMQSFTSESNQAAMHLALQADYC